MVESLGDHRDVDVPLLGFEIPGAGAQRIDGGSASSTAFGLAAACAGLFGSVWRAAWSTAGDTVWILGRVLSSEVHAAVEGQARA